MKTLGTVIAALVLAAGACGGSESAQDVLAETADHLGEIESGTLVFRLAVSSQGQDVGFALTGPFALAKEEGKLPLAEVEYTQLAGSEQTSTVFISTGDKAFVRIGPHTFELPAELVDDLRASKGSPVGAGGLEELEIGDWFRDPEVSDGGEFDGDAVDRVRAKLDAVAAANDLIAVANAFGERGGSPLEGKSAEQLERAVERASIEVFTGKDDRLLRRLVIDAKLGADLPPEVEGALGSLPGARFTLRLAIFNVNEKVTVEEPANAQPFSGE